MSDAVRTSFIGLQLCWTLSNRVSESGRDSQSNENTSLQILEFGNVLNAAAGSSMSSIAGDSIILLSIRRIAYSKFRQWVP